MTDITIYHNPNCGTSRNVLALIRNSGVEPSVIEYLKTPPGRDRLVALIAQMKVPVRDMLRQKGTPHDELQLGKPIARAGPLDAYVDLAPEKRTP